jgi:hypothetical protein
MFLVAVPLNSLASDKLQPRLAKSPASLVYIFNQVYMTNDFIINSKDKKKFSSKNFDLFIHNKSTYFRNLSD